jgi:ABC-type phosphate/phosphonate transport system substrate-binding protein
MFGSKGNAGVAIGLLVGLAVAGLAAVPGGRGEESIATSTVRVGVVKTALRNCGGLSIAAQLQPVKVLIDSQTGLDSQLSVTNTAEELGKQLADGKAQFGVFHGVEFAWARQKHPALRPLVVAVTTHDLRAYLVVRSDNPASCCADLAGKTCALPPQTRAFCHLFLDRCCRECGGTPQHFFARITSPASIEAALALVIEGESQATVVDAALLDWYRHRRPENFARLKTIQQSEAFPCGVIAYVPGSMDEARLSRFREGLLTAHKNSRGESILSLCQLKRFDVVPADYDEQLATIAKTYPEPHDDAK